MRLRDNLGLLIPKRLLLSKAIRIGARLSTGGWFGVLSDDMREMYSMLWWLDGFDTKKHREARCGVVCRNSQRV